MCACTEIYIVEWQLLCSRTLENVRPLFGIEEFGRKGRGELGVSKSWGIVLFHELDVLFPLKTYMQYIGFITTCFNATHYELSWKIVSLPCQLIQNHSVPKLGTEYTPQ